MPPYADAPGRPLLPALTGIRFLAALAVFLHHLPRPGWAPAPLATFMASGYNGVTVFFVLSGFVICLNYADALRRPTARATWNYAVGRLARIYPLYLAALVFVVVLTGVGRPDRLPWHLFAVQAWSPDLTVAYAYNAPGWSIGVEFFLYACFPALAFALAPIARRPAALWAAGAAVVLALLAVAVWFQASGLDLAPADPDSAHRWLYRMPLLRLGDFAVGAIAALLFRLSRERTAGARAPAVRELATWAPALAIVGLMCWPGKSAYTPRLDALWVVPTALLYLGLARHPGASLSRVLASRPLVLLGETSFAFYLVHRPLQHAFDAERLVRASPPRYAVFVVLLVALTAALAIGLHHVLEVPARDWLNARLRLPTPVRPPDEAGRRGHPVPAPTQPVPARAPARDRAPVPGTRAG
ncbi:MAG TPA: acyltransferase [Pilimelia sp.]|nr:acyltransferase [Pilimelia sp.]